MFFLNAPLFYDCVLRALPLLRHDCAHVRDYDDRVSYDDADGHPSLALRINWPYLFKYVARMASAIFRYICYY